MRRLVAGALLLLTACAPGEQVQWWTSRTWQPGTSAWIRVLVTGSERSGVPVRVVREGRVLVSGQTGPRGHVDVEVPAPGYGPLQLEVGSSGHPLRYSAPEGRGALRLTEEQSLVLEAGGLSLRELVPEVPADVGPLGKVRDAGLLLGEVWVDGQLAAVMTGEDALRVPFSQDSSCVRIFAVGEQGRDLVQQRCRPGRRPGPRPNTPLQVHADATGLSLDGSGEWAWGVWPGVSDNRTLVEGTLLSPMRIEELGSRLLEPPLQEAPVAMGMPLQLGRQPATLALEPGLYTVWAAFSSDEVADTVRRVEVAPALRLGAPWGEDLVVGDEVWFPLEARGLPGEAVDLEVAAAFGGEAELGAQQRRRVLHWKATRAGEASVALQAKTAGHRGGLDGTWTQHGRGEPFPIEGVERDEPAGHVSARWRAQQVQPGEGLTVDLSVETPRDATLWVWGPPGGTWRFEGPHEARGRLLRVEVLRGTHALRATLETSLGCRVTLPPPQLVADGVRLATGEASRLGVEPSAPR